MDKLEFYGKGQFPEGRHRCRGLPHHREPEVRAGNPDRPSTASDLEGVLRARASHSDGILNGVDYSEWNPATDPMIAANYSADDPSGKAKCKQDLLKEFGLATETQLPVVGIVSRFAGQKGFDLIQHVADRMAREELIVIALGTGDREYEDMFRRLNKQYPQKFAVKIEFNNRLAHKIEAGADMFLMPSKYEPAGLNQLYSLKYGTVPIVRATGGLDDTIEQYDPATGKGTGFKFKEYCGEALLTPSRQPYCAFRDRQRWQVLMHNGMVQDYSWSVAAREYVKVYERAQQGRLKPIVPQ